VHNSDKQGEYDWLYQGFVDQAIGQLYLTLPDFLLQKRFLLLTFSICDPISSDFLVVTSRTFPVIKLNPDQ